MFALIPPQIEHPTGRSETDNAVLAIAYLFLSANYVEALTRGIRQSEMPVGLLRRFAPELIQ
jgi:hypothetical protein